jgi:hypothetical protein
MDYEFLSSPGSSLISQKVTGLLEKIVTYFKILL